MSHLTTERKQELFSTHGGSATNTGSVPAQVAMLTERILHIAAHMKGAKKDHHSNRGLLKMVGQRKRLLSYMQRTDLQGYRSLIEKLGLRK
jgi:small subunit ribosomal protein S15